MNENKRYNPNIHHRGPIRLKGYDYSQAGIYFITICCQDRACLFGKITDGMMVLNEAGQMVNCSNAIITNVSSAMNNPINVFRHTS